MSGHPAGGPTLGELARAPWGLAIDALGVFAGGVAAYRAVGQPPGVLQQSDGAVILPAVDAVVIAVAYVLVVKWALSRRSIGMRAQDGLARLVEIGRTRLTSWRRPGSPEG